MTNESNYYQILHVSPDAPAEVIRASYRTLMHSMRLHPDLGGPGDRAAQINEAYRVLSNPARRAHYDKSVRTDMSAGISPDGFDDPAQPLRCLFCNARASTEARKCDDAICGRCDSPLALAPRHRFEHSMRRMLRRIDRHLPIKVHTAWDADSVLDGRMENLSLNGMRFATGHALIPNQLIKIDCVLCKALARVSHCQPTGKNSFVTGVEFVTIVFSSNLGTFVSETA
jgi:hypothetical protein